MTKANQPHTVEYSVNLRADAGDVFDFHLHPKNLLKLSPAGIRIRSLVAPEIIQPGSELYLKVAFWGIPQSWHVRVREVRGLEGRPARAVIVDEAVRGPFPFWLHRHEFFQDAAGSTRLVDHVEFLPPGGPWGVVLVPGIRFMLGKMFAARHEATRRLLEKK